MTHEEFFEVFKNSAYLNKIQEFQNLGRTKKTEPCLEKHHIFPVSWGGSNRKANLVVLSKEEHILVHLLLVVSFEQVFPDSYADRKEYWSAVKAINACCFCRWEKLTQEEKENLFKQVPEIGRIRKQAVDRFVSETLEKSRATHLKKYGSINGGCHTPEARAKASKTTEERFGKKAGYFWTPEAFEKNKKSRMDKYGTLIPGFLTEEARKKARQSCFERYGRECLLSDPEVRAKSKAVMIAKYGSNTGFMNKPEIKAKNHRIHVERFGSMTGAMNTPEIVKKRTMIKKHNEAVRTFWVTQPEFLKWYGEERDQNIKSKRRAVKSFLEEKHIDIRSFEVPTNK